MRRLLLLIFALFSGAAHAQVAGNSSLQGQPIEITASGGTQYEGGVATARENVAIHIGDTDIYADYATYNSHTKEVHVRGNVRIYRGPELYVGDRGTYNTETKAISADTLRSAEYPFFVSGERLTSLSENAKLVEKGSFTTHDSANPDFQIRATKVRIYENDRVILQNATFYVGRVPIFYWPYLYQSLDDSFSFVLSPAYMTIWGPSLLGRVTFPITENIKGTVRLDYRTRRGAAIGFQPDIVFGKNNSSFAKIRTYLVRDENPTINRTTLPRSDFPDIRYRLSMDSRTRFTSDIEAVVRFSKLSDPFMLQDFFQSEFRLDPVPDNFLAVTKTDPRYTLIALTRYQVNTFHETTERLPEIALDITRQPLFGSGVFYEGEASMTNFRRNFANRSPNQDYTAVRLDTFHQFLYPQTYFGWLSVVPRVGARGTLYTSSRDLEGTIFTPSPEPLIPTFLLPPPTHLEPLQRGGERFRAVVNAGVETSFKISRVWEQAQSRSLGLDGLRHIAQPFANFSYVHSTLDKPAEILQFDRYQPSTQLRPIDFPQFISIDSIDNWTIARVGVRNRLQTRRDDVTINWLELETYFDINFDNPYDRTDFSNVYNRLRFNPLPWASLSIYSQLPLLADGFSEVNADIGFKPAANWQLNFGYRYLDENPFFPNSSLFFASAHYRINDHWGAGAFIRYEARTGFVEEQRYSVYRDLTSWVASLGTVIRNNGGVKEYGVLLSFSLKALPKLGFDLNFDPGAVAGDNQQGVPTLP
ncbi:hypothetical protein BH20VER1_BH20VER1_09890 [soil metagenome]